MNPFIAFRSAAFAVFRPHFPHHRTVVIIASCSHNAAFHTSRPRLVRLAFDSNRDKKGKGGGAIPPHIPIPKPQRGRKIKSLYVHFRDLKTGELGPLILTKGIVDSVDEDTHYVELVEEDPPVVKIVDIKEARAATLASRLKGKGHKEVHKEAQLSWHMSEADELHKLQKVREDLEKGCRVDLMYRPKRGHKNPPLDEMRTKLRRIAERFSDVSKEWKDAELARGQGMVFLQSKIRHAKPKRDELKESVPKLQELRKVRAEKNKKHVELNNSTVQLVEYL